MVTSWFVHVPNVYGVVSAFWADDAVTGFTVSMRMSTAFVPSTLPAMSLHQCAYSVSSVAELPRTRRERLSTSRSSPACRTRRRASSYVLLTPLDTLLLVGSLAESVTPTGDVTYHGGVPFGELGLRVIVHQRIRRVDDERRHHDAERPAQEAERPLPLVTRKAVDRTALTVGDEVRGG